MTRRTVFAAGLVAGVLLLALSGCGCIHELRPCSTTWFRRCSPTPPATVTPATETPIPPDDPAPKPLLPEPPSPADLKRKA